MRPTEATMHNNMDERYQRHETDQKENKRTQNYDRTYSSSLERPRSKSTGKKDSRDQTNVPREISPVKHSQMQQLQEQIRQLEKAKDSFRDETIELRHQLKRLRQNNINMSSFGSVSDKSA